MRRLRKTGAVDQDRNVLTIPRLASVTGANKPPGRNRWSEAEKVRHLLGRSLLRIHKYLCPGGLLKASIPIGSRRRRRSPALSR
jgi:hypothetical protein